MNRQYLKYGIYFIVMILSLAGIMSNQLKEIEDGDTIYFPGFYCVYVPENIESEPKGICMHMKSSGYYSKFGTGRFTCIDSFFRFSPASFSKKQYNYPADKILIMNESGFFLSILIFGTAMMKIVLSIRKIKIPMKSE